jgi:hypothetical protein
VAESLKEKQSLLQQIGELEAQVAITSKENDELSEKVSYLLSLIFPFDQLLFLLF